MGRRHGPRRLRGVRGVTFHVNKLNGELWLCTDHGMKIAEFKSQESIKIFWEIFNLAKASSHAHGLNGI